MLECVSQGIGEGWCEMMCIEIRDCLERLEFEDQVRCQNTKGGEMCVGGKWSSEGDEAGEQVKGLGDVLEMMVDRWKGLSRDGQGAKDVGDLKRVVRSGDVEEGWGC